MSELYPIDKSEVFRFLHCKSNDNLTNSLVNKCCEELFCIAKPRFLYRTFTINIKNNEVLIEGTTLTLCGSDIVKHLENCSSVILNVATLGESVDRKIRIESATNLEKSVILDACAGSMIESVLNVNEAKLRKTFSEQNLFITSRFSPGYGNLPIEIQGKFLDVLDAGRKIGVFATSENLLCPHKSVTSIIGVSTSPVVGTLASCNHCVLKNKCEFRLRGTTCFKNEECD